MGSMMVTVNEPRGSAPPGWQSLSCLEARAPRHGRASRRPGSRSSFAATGQPNRPAGPPRAGGLPGAASAWAADSGLRSRQVTAAVKKNKGLSVDTRDEEEFCQEERKRALNPPIR